MSDKPDALKLADWLEFLATVFDMGRMPVPTDYRREAAAELRRLHAAETDFHMAYRMKCDEETKVLHAQRDALLEALKLARSIIGHPDDAHSKLIDAAIEAVEGEKNDLDCS